MDTQTCIDLLTIELVGLNDEIARDTKRATAYQIAIDQLRTTLVTQLAELEQEKLNSQRLLDNNTLLTTKLTDVTTALQDSKQPDDTTRLTDALAILNA